VDKLANPPEAAHKREGLRGNPALYEANRKQQEAKEQAEYDALLESPQVTPPIGTPTPKITGAREKNTPSINSSKIHYAQQKKQQSVISHQARI
jgi:hypothetical protein